MKKKMSKKTILLIVGIVLLFSITLGAAILSSVLNIEGNTTIKENSWIIYFDSVRKSSDSVASSNDARITNYEKTRIDFSANLKEPGDFYEFTVYTVNDGTIDAMVDHVEKFELSEEQKKYLDFSVTYDNGREIKRCDPLDAGTRKRIKAIVKFKDGMDLSDYSGEDVNLNLYFDIHYVQKDDACPADPTGNEHILTIRPHGGTFRKRTDETRIYIEPGQTYELEDPTRYLYNFTGWEKILPETDGTFTLENNIFTMGDEDVTLEAQWEEGAYVARIMNKYYTSIQEAFDAVDSKDWDDNTVYLLKNQNEDPINRATHPFAFNLGGYTVTGRLINQKDSEIRLVNGKIIAEEDQQEAAINYGVITLGTQGGGVQVENSIALIGNEVGLRNVNKVGNYGNFYFYDGYIEAVAALVGGYSDVEEGYFIFSEHIPERNDQRVYLVKNPNRAVAKTTTDGVIYYYNLQDAINQASINKRVGELPDTDYVITAVRNFEAAYKLKVKSDETIIFDLDGRTVSTGDTITNNGNFTIKNTSQTAAAIKPSRTFTNTNNLNISNVSIRSTADENTFNNSGSLNLNKVTIQAKAGYGINNTDNGTISLDENTIISSNTNYGIHNTASNLVLDNGTIYAIENTGKLTLTGNVNPRTNNNKNPIYNTGTLILEQLEHTDTYGDDYIYTYGGSVTVNGGKLQNRGTVIDGYSGSVVLNNVDIKSTDSAAISGSYVEATLNSGKVESNTNAAFTCNSLIMNSGEVIGKGRGVNVTGLTLKDGTITSDEIGAYASSANIQGGTITGTTYGLSSNSLTLSGGAISATDGIGVDTSSANISGGTITGTTYGLKTNSISMTNGTITATDGVGVLLNTEGTIIGGTISGETYGVQAKNKIILGTNDEVISSTSPVIIGNLYGLYIEGNDINFYDGILKGQTDGYYGKITGLPTGGLVVDGTETINDILYQTDTVNAYSNWLQVGDEQFNNIDSACEAITESGTITVIDDVDVRFIQNFTKNNGVDREITFDLNGHTITTTQPIYNHTNVTIVDSSNEKTGHIIASRVRGIVNETDGTLTIDAGEYETTTANVPVENRNRMIINYAKITATTLGLRNYGYLTINDASIEGCVTGIENNVSSSVYPNCGTRGYVVINGGTISATDTAIQKGDGTIVVNGGSVYGTSYGIGGSSGSAIINGGLVKATTNNALYTYSGTLQVTDGQVISENNIAMLSHANMYVEGGYVEGTKGIQNEQYCSWVSCWYNDTYVSGGHIVGKTNEGINYQGDSTGQLVITGGVVEGQTNGVTTTAKVRLGTDDENVSITTPVLIGHTTYGIKHTNYTEFYDGILKGIVDGRNGLVGNIPDGYLIKDDYEYIDRVEYQTDYLVEKGNWLKVGNKEFNSINKANQYITEENHTMTVIADAYVDYKQTINANYDVVFDFNGHSLIMTQPIQVNSNTRFVNTQAVGGINNLRDNVLSISGVNVVIDGGVYHSDTTTAIVNSGTLTINDAEIRADYNYVLSTSGPTIINGGLIRGSNNANGITNSNTLTVNGGEIYTEKQTAISTSSTTTTINGGTITSEKSNAIYVWDSTLEVNNGAITSNENVAISTSNSTYHSTYVTINNGEITGHTTGINAGHGNGTLTINDGHIVGTTGTGVITYPTSYINGGNLEGGQYGLRVASSSNIAYIGNDDGTINIDAPSIKGDLYGLYTESSNTVHFYDGIIKGITGRHSGVINTIASHAQIFEDEEVINGLTYLTEYLVTETEIVINEDTQITYGNLQEAITQAQTGETLRLLTNVPLYYEIAVINNPNITLNMDGKTISTNKPWRITVPFTITNTSENEAMMKISTAVNLITTTDNLTINNVTLKNTASSNYVVNNSGKLSLNGVKVDSINGIQSSNELTIVNGTINATGNTITNTGKMTITGGTYTGGNYSLYSNSSKTVNIAYATFNGIAYNSGNNTVSISDSEINGNLQNNTSNLTMYRSNIRTGRVTNSGTLTMNDSTFTATTTQYDYYYYQDVAMANSGTLTLNHSNVMINKEEIGKSSTAIHNTGELNINNDSKVYIGLENNSNYSYKGVYTTSNGLTTIENSEVKVTGGITSYGLYIDGANAKAIVLTGAVKTELATTSYGVYIDKGTFEMGHYEGQGVTQEEVSTTNPLIQSEGKSRGIGVKKVNASFNFYDGMIRASKYSKPETTTNVEYQFEVTTYVENDTGYEYAILEWMRNDYQGDTVCLLNDVYYKTVQDAIDKAEAGDEIILLKSVEENITIPTNKNVKLNLNQHSITTKVTNNGTFNVYNGSLQSFDTSTIINRGTLILGENDNTVSSSNIRIVSETTTIQSTGTIIMYDGYIEGTQAIDGRINQIAQYARIRTVHDEQSEKKFIQSLSPEAIMSGETDLIITIDPNSGLYEESREIKEIFKKYHETYTLSTPTKRGCNFVGWELSDDAVFDTTTNTITVDISDVTAKALWEVSSDAVAKIGEEYYLTLQEALDNANEGDLVELLKNTTEDITNRSNVKLDLGGFTVTGAFINQGELRIINGTIENPDGIGMINQKLLTMGENDGEIHEDNVKIIGTNIGLQQDARFRFYDGFIEGDIALYGRVDAVPQGYFLYNDRNNVKNCQRVYLIGNPANAVAIIDNGGTQYFFSLQSAIDTAVISGDEIYIARSFEAAYPITVPEGANITINMNSYNITTGNEITNNGTLRIYDVSEEDASITTARPIVNNGTLTIDGMTIKQNTSSDAVTNNGTLNVVGGTIESAGYAVRTNGPMTMDANSVIKRTDGGYAIYNNYEGLTLTDGETSGIYNAKSLTIGEDFVINSTHNNSACVHSTTNNATLTWNGATCTAENIGISMQGQNQTFTMTDGSITSKKQGLYVNNTNGSNTTVIDNGSIVSTSNYGIYYYGRSHNLTINDGLIKSNSSSAIWIDSWSSSDSYKYNVTINGGEINGGDYGAVFYYTKLDINGGTFITRSTSRDRYAIWYYYGKNSTIKDATLITDSASGMYTRGYTQTFENTKIESNCSNGYGIYMEDTTININNGTKITTNGTSSTGVMMSGNSNTHVLNINGGEIKSANVGINTNSANYTRTINVNSGRVAGSTYGIYEQISNATVNIGNSNNDLSTEQPLVTGGIYGAYKTAGTLNFYNGQLRGHTYGFNESSVNTVRKSKEITSEEEDSRDEERVATYTTTETSQIATSNTPKIGNGYARITYIGEDSVCADSQWDFDYTGTESIFTPLCSGKYKLEVWGAQGGNGQESSNSIGGYGGYATGEITLSTQETIYINVGGQGESNTNQSGTSLGGYNGGGRGYRAGGGGGATHIATTSGLLSSLSDNKGSIIIVAGAGGGGAASRYSSTSRGGSGGGYIGENGYKEGNRCSVSGDNRCAIAGNQTAGGYTTYGDNNATYRGKFGAGGDAAYFTIGGAGAMGGGGAGWYGGSGTYDGDADLDSGGGAGGSGYLGNSRISNVAMYGYNVQTTEYTWIKNYLIDKDKFLQVNEETFNSIDNAVAYIIENLNGTGTIKVLKNATIEEDSTILENTNITLDLNGKVLTITRPITNNANFTIIDSTEDKTGKITSTKTNIVINQSNLHVVNGTFETPNNTVFLGRTNEGTMTIDEGVTLTGYAGINTSTKYTITLDHVTINATTSTAFISSGASSNITITDSTISSRDASAVSVTGASSIINLQGDTITAKVDAVVPNTAPYELTITDCTINGTSSAIALYGNRGTVNVSNSSITGTSYGVYINSYSMNMTLTGNTIKCNNGVGIHDVYNGGSNNVLTLTGGTVEGQTHGVFTYYTSITTSNVTIKTNSTNIDQYAFYTNYNSPTIVFNEETKLLAPSASGLRNATNTTINDVEITASGATSYGIANVESGNLKLYGGTINSGKYGIYQNNANATTTIGKSEEALSIDEPLIIGAQYGFYKTAGKSNIYSGRLKGNTESYHGDFNKARKGYKVYTFDEVIDEEQPDVTRKVSYLTETEAFLQVGDDPENVFNTFEDAIAATNATDTITVLNDNLVYENVEFPAGKNITLNLNNYDLGMTQTIVNKGTLTIIGGNDNTKNKITNSYAEGINNKGTLTLEDMTFTTSSPTIRASEGNNPITITNCDIKGSSPIRMDANQLLTITDTKIEATNGHAIVQSANNQKTVVTNCNIKATDQGIVQNNSGNITEVTGTIIKSNTTGISQNTSNQSLTIKSSTISGGTYGVYSYGSRNTINISENTKLTGGDIGLYQNHNLSSDYTTINLTDTSITGLNYGVYVRGVELNTTNTKITVTTNNKDRFAADCEAYARCNFGTDTELIAKDASGLYLNTYYTINLENTKIDTDLSNGYGIFAYDGTLNINEGTQINTNGYQSYGIYQSHYDVTTTINGGEIYSKNIGVYMGCDRSETKKLNVNKGRIVGETYGISQTCSSSTTTIGNLNDEVSITDPYVEGGLISINKTNGILNFYSGLLKGYVRGNPGTVDGVRTGYEIFDDEDEAQIYIRTQKTVSTTDHSETAISNTAKEGNGYSRIKYEEYIENEDTVIESVDIDMIGRPVNNNGTGTVEITEETEFDYTGDIQTYQVQFPGRYKLEVWGAQGGSYNTSNVRGGYGSYSVGYADLDAGTMYVAVGGQGSFGNNRRVEGGFNGGGFVHNRDAGGTGSASGGGATHIALVDGELSNLVGSQESVLIVAGGGGGSVYGNDGGHSGGDAGGYVGNGSVANGYGYATGGTQTAGGSTGNLNNHINTVYAAFGQGAGSSGNGNTWYGGAGGGGFYGGGYGGTHSAGAGGSGYIGNSRLEEKHMTCFSCSETVDPEMYTISTTDKSSEAIADTPKLGNGYAKITYLGGNDIGNETHTILLESEYGTIANQELTYNDGDALGTIPQPVLNNNNMEFIGWYTDRKFTKKVTNETLVYMSATLYARFEYKNDYCRSVEGVLTTDFDYTGAVEEYVVPCPGKYKLEVWGAQGGNSQYNSNKNTGGYGGYTTGEIELSRNTKLYVTVGGQGNGLNYQQSSGVNTYDNNKGYNGGGYAVYYTNNSAHAGGGGATHIATKRGLLTSFANYKSAVLIVAGGGGGASTHSAYPSYSGDGGSGGGAVAGSGITTNTTCYNYGTGGTQNTGGTFVACTSDGRTSRDSAPVDPKFGAGSNYTSNSSSATYSGGGAGWYGGQSGWHAPGGGGSGYISPRIVDNAAMYGYNVDEAYSDNKSNIAYLIEQRELIKNLTTDETYLSLQDAIDEANQDETLQYISNDYMSYNAEIPVGKHIIIDLNGFNITTSKTITNNGTLTIENTNEDFTSKITNNASVTEIVNNGTLTLDNVKMDVYNGIDSKENATLTVNESDINARNNGINNAGKMTVEASTIYGPNYDIYSNSAKTELISNTTLKASSNAYYKYSNGDTTITDSSIRGTINNSRTGQPLEVKDSVITSYIRNTGNTTYTNNEIKTTMPNDSTSLIYNTGTLTLDRNDIEYKTNTTNGSYYSNTLLDNRGTVISNNNDYFMEFNYNGDNTYNNRYRYLYLVQNYGLLTSTGDDYESRGGYEMFGIYNNSSNASTISNGTIHVYYGSDYIRGIHNESGNITTSNTSIEVNNANKLYGTYIKNGTVTENTTNVNVHHGYISSSYSSYATYMENGTYTHDGGNIYVNNVYNGYGTFVSAGTYNFKNGHMELSNNTNSYGVYLNNSSVVYTQGIYDGRGTEDSDVSETSPYISAIGTTTGIGVRMGGGTFNYYDGYILGSTSPRAAGDITTSTELNYQVITKQDEITGYNYCILEYNK